MSSVWLVAMSHALKAFLPNIYQNVNIMLTDVKTDELFVTESDRYDAERRGQEGKRNFFVKEMATSRMYFVKATPVEKSLKEWGIGQLLRRYNISNILVPVAKFQSQFPGDNRVFGFNVFEYVPSVSLAQIKKQNVIISTKEWIKGLLTMVKIYYQTDPNNILTETTLHLTHQDLNGSQILYNPKEREWYLADFGHAQVLWIEPQTEDMPSVVSKILASSSAASGPEEFEKFFELFLSGVVISKDKELKKRIKECKNLPPDAAYQTLLQIYESLPAASEDCVCITLHEGSSVTPVKLPFE